MSSVACLAATSWPLPSESQGARVAGTLASAAPKWPAYTWKAGREMRRTVIALLGTAALSLGLGVANPSVASASTPAHSLRSFCIDYQDYGSYNPTSRSEWKLALSSVKDLVKESPDATLKSDLKSMGGFIEAIINKNGNVSALSKTTKEKLASLAKKMDTSEQKLCKQYQGDG